MATKRHKPEEIVSKLRQVDVLAAQAELATDRATLKATEERFERIVGMPPGSCRSLMCLRPRKLLMRTHGDSYRITRVSNVNACW